MAAATWNTKPETGAPRRQSKQTKQKIVLHNEWQKQQHLD